LSFPISIPAACQISSSAKCVPLLSPRDTNGACAALIRRNASAASLPPATFARSAFGPISTNVVVHHVVAPEAESLREKLLLQRPGVHEHDVGIAAPSHVERLPGPSATTRTCMPVFLSKIRQQVLEQPGLLGRRRRCDRDVGLCVRGRAEEKRDESLKAIPTAALL
jgi:hypothetical protein